MKIKRAELAQALRITGECPSHFGLAEIDCGGMVVGCHVCWEKAIEDVETIEFEG